MANSINTTTDMKGLPQSKGDLLCPIERKDLKDLSKRFNQITITGYDSTTNLDRDGFTFEERLQKCDKPPSCVKFVKPIGKGSDIFPKNLISFVDIEALDISECGLREIPQVLLKMGQLKVLKMSDNHIHSLPDDWGHLDLTALDISKNELLESNMPLKRLVNVEVLVMASCNIKDFPFYVLQLNKLRSLTLDDNPIGPLDFGTLESDSMQSLSLRSCLIAHISGRLLSNLQYIDLRSNSIQHLPTGLSERITILKLGGNQLDMIPENISCLKELTKLDVSSCELKEFPQPVLRLRKLQDLNISNNCIHDIPKDILNMKLKEFCFGGNPLDEFLTFLDRIVVDLEEIDLSSSFLEEIPSAIQKSRNLKTLKINDNCIEVFPELLSFQNLEKLEMKENPVKQLPKPFQNAYSLRILDISSTNLQEVPPQILRLAKIEGLTMTNCALEVLPDDWKECLKISQMDLSENLLSTLPASISQLQKLEKLDLKSCCFKEFPEVLLQMSNLHTLNLEQNLIQELPNNFQSLSLKKLNMRSNLLSDLSDALSANTHLSDLDVSSNRLTNLPEVIFRLQNLKHLKMDDNIISILPRNWQRLDIVTLSLKNNPIMNIDHLLDELPSITNLNLQKCLLKEMPANLSSAVRLTTLNISDNKMTSISTLPPNVIYLTLDNNPLELLPDSTQHLQLLNTLSAQRCGLKDLPTFIFNLKRLAKLFLSNNCLKHLPDELNNTILNTIDISWNPINTLDSLYALKCLRILRADACRLHMFPKEVLNLQKLTELSLRWNGIRSLSDDLQHSNLTHLLLYGNTIKTLPSAMSNLKYLRTLSLSEITEFPKAALHLSNLVYFSIDGKDSDNHIMLPDSLKDMTHLQRLVCNRSCHFLPVGSLRKLLEVKIFSAVDAIPSDVIKSKFLKTLLITSRYVKSHYSPPPIQNTLLKSLEIHNYRLSYFPDTLAEMTRLEVLRIRRTNLKIFPEVLSTNLKKLKILEISANDLMTLPKVWRSQRLTDLNVSEVPSEAWYLILPQLPNITKLSISGCRLFSFPTALQLLRKLEDLDVSNNHIRDLPTEWHNIFLKVLNMADNSLGGGSTLGVISHLSSIQILNLSGNNLDQFPSGIHCLKYLRDLDVSVNPLGAFPKVLKNLQSLEIFKGSACELDKFPKFLLKLKQIKWIELNRNRIKRLPCKCRSFPLEILDLSDNKGLQMTSDDLSGVGSIDQLYLSSCGLTKIPELVLHVPILRVLNLENNPIKRIPEDVYQAIKGICRLRLNASNLIEPPKEIYEGSHESIEQYYAELEMSQACKVGFHNVILLGSTTAGKTSLIQSLIKGESTLTQPEDRTITVDQETWALMENLHFHVIDFGGHDVYELAYPIFLKDRKGSIIIAVDLSKLSHETVENDLFKWLQTVLSITGTATDIIIAGTKVDLCDDAPRKMNFLRKSIDKWIEQMLDHADRLLNTAESFEGKTQIEHFKEMAVQEVRTIATSCLSMTGLEKLRKILLNHSKENVAKLPGSWYEMYENLARLKTQRHSEGFYRVAQLPRFCSQSMTTLSVQTCLKYMHQRGMVLWYGNDSNLKDYVFYDITFIIATLKELLTHDVKSTFETKLLKPFFHTMNEQKIAIETFRETGMATQNLLRCIWQNVADTDEIFNVALRILKLFHLCYETDSSLFEASASHEKVQEHSKERVIYFPWFVCNATGPELEQLWPQQVPPNIIPIKCNFTFEYSVPTSLFEQFSVQLQSLLAKGHHRKDWRNMIYVKQDAVQLLVRHVRDTDRSTASLVIELRAKSENAYQMYKLCMSVVKTIQILRKKFPGILYNEEYVCPHCILTNAETPYTIPVDEALQDYPDGTKLVYCKKDGNTEVPAALHYPKLLGNNIKIQIHT